MNLAVTSRSALAFHTPYAIASIPIMAMVVLLAQFKGRPTTCCVQPFIVHDRGDAALLRTQLGTIRVLIRVTSSTSLYV
jgi:hypothetical protein